MIPWDLRRKPTARRLSEIPLPEPEVSAIATSGTTVEVVDRRLRELHGLTGKRALEEVEYLLGVRSRLVEAQRTGD